MTKPTEKENVIFLLPSSALFKFNAGAVLWQSVVNSSSGTLPLPCEVSLTELCPILGTWQLQGCVTSTKGQQTHRSRISSIHIPELLCPHQRISSRTTRISLSFAQIGMGEGFSRLPKPAAEGSSSSREQILTHFHYSTSQLPGSLSLLWHSTQIHGLGQRDPLLWTTLYSTCKELWNILFNAPTSSGTFLPSLEFSM